MIFEKQILKRYRAAAFRRYDDTGTARYFGPEDFPGLIAEPVSFPNRAGDLLAGWFYSCFAPKEGRLVVFDHGIGGGHRSYMKEIALLAEAGYRVFAYDHTGCMASGGECTRGMSGSLADLDDALSYLRETHGIPDESISVIGHSWGGFAALNISRYHPFLSHVVAISGFLSVPRLLASSLGGFPLPAPYREAICALERDVNPGYADSDAISSLAGSGAKVLLIYSDNDPLIRKKLHYDPLYEAFSQKSNFTFLLEKGKLHNPHYTREAVGLLSAYMRELSRKSKRRQLKTEEQRAAFRASFDWDAMTAQDPDVWEKILDHLGS
ncbi:MAG: alpha/beta fold hydrolase [Clostridia bacterium]|nr:alpha/beta fold hydrolase [Clostridia bacterium]